MHVYNYISDINTDTNNASKVAAPKPYDDVKQVLRTSKQTAARSNPSEIPNPTCSLGY